MVRNLGFLVFAVTAVSACSAPGGAPPPTAAVAVPTPSAVASAGPALSGSRAKTCSINGLSWGNRETQINPTMVVSNDGFCGTHVHVDNIKFNPMMQVYAKPNHGRIDTFGADSARPGFRYYPEQGYVGPDSFVMVTGTGRHEILANFSVTVSD